MEVSRGTGAKMSSMSGRSADTHLDSVEILVQVFEARQQRMVPDAAGREFPDRLQLVVERVERIVLVTQLAARKCVALDLRVLVLSPLL